MSSFQVWHTHGSKPCGQLAWTFIRHPSASGALVSANAVMPNGEHPASFARTICGSCGELVGPRSITLGLREVESIAP